MNRNPDWTAHVLAAVTRALGSPLRDVDPANVFEALLADALALTGSELGSIAEVVGEDEQASLRIWATSGQLDAERFYRPDQRDVVIWDTPSTAPSPDRPSLGAAAVVPILRGDAPVGQLVLANRPDGYDTDLIVAMAPLVNALGLRIDAFRLDRERLTAGHAARRAERLTEAVLSEPSELVTVRDADGQLTLLVGEGKGTRDYYESAPEVLMQHVAPDDRAAAIEAYRRLRDGGIPITEPFLARVGSGREQRVFEVVGRNLLDDPDVRGLVHVQRDVTARVRAEQHLLRAAERLTMFVSALRDAVVFVDDDGRVVFVNEAFCEIWGIDEAPADLVGRLAKTTVLDPHETFVDPVGFLAEVAAITVSGELTVGLEFTLRDGRVVEADHLPVTLGDGREGHVWLWRDVTDSRELDIERVAKLEREYQLRLATEERNLSLQQLADLKNEFVATVAHELRTPLTAVVGFAELLSADADGLSAEQREFLRLLERNADRLLRLVAELLDLARLESGNEELDVGEVDVAALVSNVVDSFGPVADERGVRVECRLPAQLGARLDLGRMERVVDNVISNALKFTDAGGSVKVDLSSDGETWRLVVRDDGIGITEEDRCRVFQRFQRGANVQAPGSGLGLALSRAIVERHGGTIDLSSELHVGTVVTIEVPVLGGKVER